MICNPVIAGTKLPDLANPGTAADLAKGKELIGADGQVVTGSIPNIEPGAKELINNILVSSSVNSASITLDRNNLMCIEAMNVGTKMLKNGAYGIVLMRPYVFGNATASDVAKGKTFTSSSGVDMIGTGTVYKYGWNEGDLPVLTSELSGTNLLLMCNMDHQGLQLITRTPTYLVFTDKTGTTFAVPLTNDLGTKTVAHVSNGNVFKELQVTVNTKNITAMIKDGANEVTEFIPSGRIALTHGAFPQASI